MAGIIKSDNWQSGNHGVQSAAFNFEDMSEKAQAYLDVVRQKAEQIIETANQNARQIEEQAKKQGQQAANREAHAQVQMKLDQRLQTLLPALSQAIEGIHRERESWLRHWEQRTVTLAVAIAEKVIRREVETKPDITLNLVKEALELAVGGGTIKLCLNPEDYETLGDRAQHVATQLVNHAPTEIVADPEITKGGCRVVSEFGEIDQTIEAQLSRIEEELND